MSECVAMGELINCDDIKVFIDKSLPTISVEKSNGVEIITTADSMTRTNVRTTASQSVSFAHPKANYNPKNEEEDPTTVVIIPETYICKMVDGKFSIEALDMSE